MNTHYFNNKNHNTICKGAELIHISNPCLLTFIETPMISMTYMYLLYKKMLIIVTNKIGASKVKHGIKLKT